MITLVCGENTITSRNYFLSLKKESENRNLEVVNIRADQIFELNKWLSQSISLFGQKKAFFLERLNSKIRGLKDKKIEELKKLANDKECLLYIWEDVELRMIKYGRFVDRKEFKPDKNIFKLLDRFYPGNKKEFLNYLSKIKTDKNALFIFLMISKLIRNLLLVKSNSPPKNMFAWQVKKLENQANHWQLSNLTLLYQAFLSVDIALKTSSTPFSPSQSLDILACYFL